MEKSETSSKLVKPGSNITVGKHRISSNNGIYDLLQCPVCRNLMFPPIHQCPNGHTLCSDCKIKVQNSCPTCNCKLRNIRCLALEKTAECLQLNCRHQSLGCQAVLPIYAKIKHEQRCVFRPYNCPYAGSECSVTGDIETLVAHLEDDHKVDIHNGCSFNHRYVKSSPHEVDNAIWMLTVFNCFGRQFCLHFEAFQLGMAPVYMAFIRFLGEEKEAKEFRYCLEVGGHRRKLKWHGIPRSIRDSCGKVRDSHDGLIVPRDTGLAFSGGDGEELRLRLMGRIWREE